MVEAWDEALHGEAEEIVSDVVAGQDVVHQRLVVEMANQESELIGGNTAIKATVDNLIEGAILADIFEERWSHK
jgi:hypothetical protein